MSEDNFHLCDYAVAFVDLLGQKEAIPGRQLPEDQSEAITLVKNSVGRIIGTQNNLQRFYDSYSSHTSIYAQLDYGYRERLPDLAPGNFKWQKFSDGLVIYVPLGEGLVSAPATCIYGMLMAAGCLCGVGLAAKAPVRIGIDVGWAVEYRPNEIYGAALAYSYQLENEIAQWPRVVIGEGLIAYLQHYASSGTTDISSQVRQKMAEVCLSLLSKDFDEHYILDYLGQNFVAATSGTLNTEIVNSAKEFALAQREHWGNFGNEKLSSRYEQVLRYIDESVDDDGRM